MAVGIVNPPTGNATITYNVQAGSTATEGADFDFTTNGNFTAASKQHVFASGVAGQQQIKVRIYDDPEAEQQETFTIGYTIGTGTNAVAGSPAVHTFTIVDNDLPAMPAGNYTATFGVNNTVLNQPFRGEFSDARTQFIYLASELRAAGFRAGNITSLGLNVVNKMSTMPFNGFTI